MDMLYISNLYKRFSDKKVLNGLNLSVPEHSIFGFIGKNGAGKTTTMKMVLGLLKADTGEIIVNGEKVVYGQTTTNRYIGYLPDVPEFYPFMTAAEYLHFCGEITGMKRTENEERCKELLELVGLGNETHHIKGFSRGMKQRLGIAQALLNRPKLLICDEPTSALDPVGRKEILDILLAIREQTTVLFSTHILSDVERICTDVAFLNNGVVGVQGKLSDIKTRYRSEEYQLETGNDTDMSRLGRDYLQVGMYTEIMFPEHDIHFIAVNDGVDSTQGDNEFTPFRNIINEWYAKDTSKKIRAVMKVKGNAGEHLTTLPPYGYMKSPDNKKLWVRDEEAAAVVYEIGLYVMDGFGPSQIARKLTERRILTPAAYYASRGRKASNIKRGLPYAWDASTVADIMDRWREYLGHTVNFKTRKKSYKSKKVIHNPESEWMIFENTHDPIWTEAIADAARAARQTRRRPTKMGEMGMFSGMMFCADCGSVMYQCRATNFRREQEYYLCAGYRKSRDFCGQTHSIRTVILEELILENLREIVSFASRSKDEFVRLVMDSDLRQRDRDLAKRKRQLADSEKRITELDAIFKRLYEDNISGKLSDERFQKLSADYEKEEQDLKVLASSLRKEVELEESKSSDVDRFLSVVERYTDIPELTPCILHEFVEKIIVHAASDPKGKNRTQEIDIYYKGIGVLEMSKVTASTEK